MTGMDSSGVASMARSWSRQRRAMCFGASDIVAKHSRHQLGPLRSDTEYNHSLPSAVPAATRREAGCTASEVKAAAETIGVE